MTTITEIKACSYTRSNDLDATTIVSGIPGIPVWVWTIHAKHTPIAQGFARTYSQAARQAAAAEQVS
jgi:hypothetical protein